jgi:fluoride exporter
MLNYFMVAIGGAVGSVARFWISTVMAERFTETFPLGTVVVNVSGSFLIGVLAAVAKTGGISNSTRLFLMVGVCGGYTTFSSFSLQNLELLQNGNYYYAGLNTGLSLVLCMFAVWLGYLVGMAFVPAK